ncbi:MAG: hypothetical protein K8J08_01420 [Thermoanaerobaculia bacterium]|nr:hypothetical protein [Thermoanaerobaculia bacterium]
MPWKIESLTLRPQRSASSKAVDVTQGALHKRTQTAPKVIPRSAAQWSAGAGSPSSYHPAGAGPWDTLTALGLCAADDHRLGRTKSQRGRWRSRAG